MTRPRIEPRSPGPLANTQTIMSMFDLLIAFVYTQLNVKTVLFQTIQFSISTQLKYQNSSISSNSL